MKDSANLAFYVKYLSSMIYMLEFLYRHDKNSFSLIIELADEGHASDRTL